MKVFAKNARTFHGTYVSILDLVPITEGSNATTALQNSVELAKHVDEWGYNRYWIAEHHNMPGIASSATSIIIGLIASETNHLRIGSGGVMLPNHAPLIIAEQFGTLDALYPGRIDLGLGRAPGTDQATAHAIRRDLKSTANDFPEHLAELETYFTERPNALVRAIPGEGANVDIWLLGSSGFSAQLAGYKGLPFSFASHFAPDFTLQALELYRNQFTPSHMLDHPYAMVGLNVIAADTDEEAELLATSLKLQFLNLNRGTPSQLQAPVSNIDDYWHPYEKEAIERTLDSRSTIIGGPEKVKRELEAFIERTKADELIIRSSIYDQQARIHSYRIIAELME